MKKILRVIKIWNINNYYATFATEIETDERNEVVPFFFIPMSADSNLNKIEIFINGLLQSEPNYFLVDLKVKPTNNIKVFIDGDEGITIEKCIYFNRKLYKLIEEAGIYEEGNFSLEISSPGVGEPLKLKRQYQKNIGRNIEVIFIDESKKDGKLLDVMEDSILVENTTGKGKKAVTQQLVISFLNIKTTTVQIKF
ncbi:MAG TPA: ribosome maturation factor [Chitinophagaceae bacterium]|nr:ribosome maturation factor [Chitinophagaceae bacterium]HNE92519.1 ribosome maturation factor [Chitinophagaceae bacterium]HNF30016.1 ribosome maturation factor [Chitinophagaceae bacterium]HNL82613.1 ribosome maturation factor [Chitinophagaceae bacterium]HNM33345.1 ribosome maturation factor [Chitinophagaceae bacterium]